VVQIIEQPIYGKARRTGPSFLARYCEHSDEQARAFVVL